MPIVTVVIPVYRSDFLSDLLDDLELQTRHDFELVLALDGPVANAEHHIQRAQRVFSTKVLRFDENIGRADPSRHWNRALQNIETEWAWLIGDDDRLGPGCLNALVSEISSSPAKHDVFRFPSQILGAEGKAAFVNGRKSSISGKEFLRLRLRGKTLSFASEYVFRVDVLREMGGFVPFPKAWCSDDATWASLAYPRGIGKIIGAGALVFWRHGTTNTSSQQYSEKHVFHDAERSFVLWILEQSNYSRDFSGFFGRLLLYRWLLRQSIQKGFTLDELTSISRCVSQMLGLNGKIVSGVFAFKTRKIWFRRQKGIFS